MGGWRKRLGADKAKLNGANRQTCVHRPSIGQTYLQSAETFGSLCSLALKKPRGILTMAGPCAAILLPEPLIDDRKTEIRRYIEQVADNIDGDDFWIEGRPFIIQFGEEYEGELAELADGGLSHLLGWTPQDTLGLVAMCNSDIDHRLLGQMCCHFSRMLGGVIDFAGTVLPEPRLDSSVHAKPVKVDDPNGLRGSLFAVSYFIENGRYGTCHYGDHSFMEAWLRHPNFRMVK